MKFVDVLGMNDRNIWCNACLKKIANLRIGIDRLWNSFLGTISRL